MRHRTVLYLDGLDISRLALRVRPLLTSRGRRRPLLWRSPPWRQVAPTMVGFGLAMVSVACARPDSELDRFSGDARQAVSSIESADPPTSYEFSYTVISPAFMACLSGTEDIDGLVDSRGRIVRLTSAQRAGSVYSLDGRVLIDTALLGESNERARYASVRLDAATASADRYAVERALGTSLSVLLAGGAWPTHPNELALAAIRIASRITVIEPSTGSVQGIRIVMDAADYAEQFDDASLPTGDQPPIIDVHIAADGSVVRLVVRPSDPVNLARYDPSDEGYSMDYTFDPTISVTVPAPPQIVELAAVDLPRQASAIPCQVEQ